MKLRQRRLYFHLLFTYSKDTTMTAYGGQGGEWIRFFFVPLLLQLLPLAIAVSKMWHFDELGCINKHKQTNRGGASGTTRYFYSFPNLNSIQRVTAGGGVHMYAVLHDNAWGPPTMWAAHVTRPFFFAHSLLWSKHRRPTWKHSTSTIR